MSLHNELIAFREARGWGEYHTPENLAKAISIEAAELLELYLWGRTWQEYNPERARDEVADIYIYLTYFAHETGVDIESAVRAKMEKNAAKYPTTGDRE